MMETLAREAMMDVIAHRLDMDPLELRRHNVVHRTELPYSTASGVVLDVISSEETLEQAADMIGYAAFRKEQVEARAEGRYLGVGLSTYIEPTAMSNAERATIRIDAAGKVTVIMGTASHGHSLETTMAQIVADYLGVDIDDIKFVQGDTAIVPSGGGTMGSRSAVAAGAAARQAALELRAKVLEIAADQMEAAPEDLELVNGVVRVRGTPARSMSLPEVAVIASEGRTLPEGVTPGLEVNTDYRGEPTMTCSNATHACTCEVDTETGEVHILRYVVSEDCGPMINPMVVEGQISGGVIQGIAGALLEHFVYDEDGNPLTTTLLDYLLPTTTEAPLIEMGHIETPSNRPGGFKGVGEGGAIGAPAAVVNAVLDALAPLGVRAITRQPLSPPRILELIDAAGQVAPASAATQTAIDARDRR
jgi:carbon-monoxide dehydrogenase large subunit